MHPPCYPTTVPYPDTALPSSGSPRGEFAGFPGTMTVLRLPPAFPPHFVAFVWQYHRPPNLFVSPVRLPEGGIKTGLDVSGSPLWSPTNQVLSVEQYGSPRFLGSPLVPLPCSWTPAAPPCHAISARRCCPRSQKDEGRSIQQIFEAASQGFNTHCLRFQFRLSLHWQDSLPVGGKPLPDGI